MNLRDQEIKKQEVPGKRKIGIPGKLLRIITFVIALMTVFSGNVSLISPAKIWFIALPGLLFPYLMTVNLILMVVWALRRRKFIAVPLLATILCWGRAEEYYQFSGQPVPVTDDESWGEPIKVMSFNVRLFDLYNWTHNAETRASIFAYFEKEQPDILCLQEFYNSTRNFKNDRDLRGILKAKHAHVEYPLTLYGADSWGIATYSAYPIVNKGVLYFDEKTANICIFTDVRTQEDTIRIYNCHLQSVRFQDEDYRFFENLGEGQEEAEKLKRTRKILSRLKIAYIKRAAQAELIAEHIRQSPHPVVLCGDFNDTPASYTYQTVAGELSDAFIESGSGTGTSYAGPLPGLRIDYILHSSSFNSFGFTTDRVKLSDHFPLSTMLIPVKEGL
jgi:endonuclease/exonuclease/phosphatase family metal-dependent hydrolase